MEQHVSQFQVGNYTLGTRIRLADKMKRITFENKNKIINEMRIAFGLMRKLIYGLVFWVAN